MTTKSFLLYQVPLFVATVAAMKPLVVNNCFFLLDALVVVLSTMVAMAVAGAVKNLMPRKLLPDLDRKAVFITGCDCGFGHMCAKRLDSLGVTVYAGCLFPEGAGASQLKTSCSDRLHVVPLDVTKQHDVDEAVRYVENTIADKVFWCVLNNAGVLSDMLLEHNTVHDVRQVMEVNTIGAVCVTQKFLPLLKASHGRAVFMSSIAACVSVPFIVPYCMSKHALQAYIDGLRRELHLTSHVSVHAIQPNTYSTSLTDKEVRAAAMTNQLARSTRLIQEQVNESRVEKYKETFAKLAKLTMNHNLNEVLDCMVDASIGAAPKLIYLPNLKRWVDGLLLNWLPTQVLDWASRNIIGRMSSQVLHPKPSN